MHSGYWDPYLPTCDAIYHELGTSSRAYSLEKLSIWGYIAGYSKRSLAYQTNSLNPVLGILAFYQQRRRICHLWGILFLPNIPKKLDL
jgi:hypothetical protein